jgi:hypothetical protein
MGSAHPYYRRRRPKPQQEDDYLRDLSLVGLIKRLVDRGTLPRNKTVRVRNLTQSFYSAQEEQTPRLQPDSVRFLTANMLMIGRVSPHIDLWEAHTEPYDATVSSARGRFDQRAAAAIFAAVSPHLGIRMVPVIRWEPLGAPVAGGFGFGFGSGSGGFSFESEPPRYPFPVDEATGATINSPGQGLMSFRALLEMKFYGDAAPTIYLPTVKTLAALAYGDFFPGKRGEDLRDLVSEALLAAAPGWCGTYGPNIGTFDLAFDDTLLEGNYDMTQQHLLWTAYAYFDEITPAAREHVITQLLARGRIYRINEDDTFTSGRAPNDWSRAGYVSPAAQHKRLGETENHIFMINAARYLSNQLIYQRNPDINFDNRRNGFDDSPSCMDVILYLLQNILLDDFSEYNAKSYQHETRTALLNLYNFAYDHEVRLAARMALDYISAHMAVSSNDCRRMVPFRRRNEIKNSAHTVAGKMVISLLDWQLGADPMTEHMAMLSGATRAYETPSDPFRPLDWSIASDGGDSTFEVLSDYRLPTPIHDLFVNDRHRRFFQFLHRSILNDIDVTGRNVDNWEIFASSPSYLITAGGEPGAHAINPYFEGYLPKGQEQQLGVALPTSFMPTGNSAGNNPPDPKTPEVVLQDPASNLVQIGRFAQEGNARNYGVGPDFLCGPHLHLPPWCLRAMNPMNRIGKFDFVNKRGPDGRPGFYLAILRDRHLAVIEAHDTWLHPELSFDDFCANVWARNQGLSEYGLRPHEDLTYKTENGNQIKFTMWIDDDAPEFFAFGIFNHGARLKQIDYGDPTDKLPDTPPSQFLHGTIMNSPRDGVVEITNPFQNKIVLDMSDRFHPRRTSESGEVEAAGDNQEVWVDFGWNGLSQSGAPLASEGDFYRPYRTLAEAIQGVADGGVVKIVPGSTPDRSALTGKRLTISAPIGSVRIG